MYAWPKYDELVAIVNNFNEDKQPTWFIVLEGQDAARNHQFDVLHGSDTLVHGFLSPPTINSNTNNINIQRM